MNRQIRWDTVGEVQRGQLNAPASHGMGIYFTELVCARCASIYLYNVGFEIPIILQI